MFNCRPDALLVSGDTAGAETDISSLKMVKDTMPQTLVLSNTRVNLNNVEAQLKIAHSAIVGTTFKYDGIFENNVDVQRVKDFMEKVKFKIIPVKF